MCLYRYVINLENSHECNGYSGYVSFYSHRERQFACATGDGVVAKADNTASGYGNHIVIRHGFGYETLYGHLSKYKCRAGQQIKRGDIIGYVGSTGRSEAPHLHYEVHKDGKVVNPINFYYGNISAAEYVAISKVANQENQSLD